MVKFHWVKKKPENRNILYTQKVNQAAPTYIININIKQIHFLKTESKKMYS